MTPLASVSDRSFITLVVIAIALLLAAIVVSESRFTRSDDSSAADNHRSLTGNDSSPFHKQSTYSFTVGSITYTRQDESVVVAGNGPIKRSDLAFVIAESGVTSLSFRRCQLDQDAIDDVHLLLGLESLSFEHCTVRDFHLPAIAACKDLRQVYLRGGYVTNKGVLALRSMRKLQSLAIVDVPTFSTDDDDMKVAFRSSLRITPFIAAKSTYTKDVSRLHLGGMSVIVSSGTVEIFPAGKSQNALLPHSQSHNFSMSVISTALSSTSIERMVIQRLPLSVSDAKCISTLKSIKVLELHDTGADDQIFQAFLSGSSVTELVLDGSPITADVASAIVSCSSIRNVSIRRCRFAAGVTSIIKMLRPDIVVTYEMAGPHD